MLSNIYFWLFALVPIHTCLDIWKGTTVNIATICKGSNKKVNSNLKRMLRSLLDHSEQAIINFHFLTDEETKPWVDATVSNIIGRHITEGVVFGYEDNNVTLKTEFIDVDVLTSSVPSDSMSTMQTLFGPVNKTIVVGESDPRRERYFPDTEPGVVLHLPGLGRFNQDLFFIAPFYHRLLPHLDKVIVIDLDLEFRVGVEEVQGLFSKLGENQLMGFVNDQSPYYPFITSGWGPPRQGVNAGLMLFQLDKMRESEEYNEELKPGKMSRLSRKFLPRSEWSLAAQDWFSLLSWWKPGLVAHLPCQYNVMFCSTVFFSKAANFSNIPCSQETAIAHFCGTEINI